MKNPIKKKDKKKGSFRVHRGGSWDHNPDIMRAAHRNSSRPSYRRYYLGFRIARSKDEKSNI